MLLHEARKLEQKPHSGYWQVQRAAEFGLGLEGVAQLSRSRQTTTEGVCRKFIEAEIEEPYSQPSELGTACKTIVFVHQYSYYNSIAKTGCRKKNELYVISACNSTS